MTESPMSRESPASTCPDRVEQGECGIDHPLSGGSDYCVGLSLGAQPSYLSVPGTSIGYRPWALTGAVPAPNSDAPANLQTVGLMRRRDVHLDARHARIGGEGARWQAPTDGSLRSAPRLSS
jgi:hypothetical protein